MLITTRFCVSLTTMFALFASSLLYPPKAKAWGEHGHRIAGQAAALKLPNAMPEFFREASDQLAYLNPEPDRWRDRIEANIDPAMNAAYAPDHFINLERIPPAALKAENRFAFLAEMRKAGMELPDAGLSPFHILEMFQRLRTEFRLWRSAPDKRTRGWIEQRIINDAGLLGHYVTDGSNPHHTTVHHHGWVGDNPRGYATDKEFHARFESLYVQTHIALADLLPLINVQPKTLIDTRAEIINYLQRTHAEVETLYEIDKRARFDEKTTAPENKRFAVARLTAGAEMLRDLWWTAWITSDPSLLPAKPDERPARPQ